MNNLNNIPGEIIKTSALPENVPTHLIGVIMGTSPQTVKYSTQSLALSVSNLITNVVKTDQFYTDPSWLVTLSWDKIISTPSTLGGYGITDPVVLTTGSYVNPSWITSIDWSKLTNVPSFSTSLSSLSDVQLGTLNIGEALVYNGTKWVNQSIGELDTLNSVTTRGNTTTNTISVGGVTVATNLISTDIGNSRVGIGTTSPSYKLDVIGTARFSGGTFQGAIFGSGTIINLASDAYMLATSTTGKNAGYTINRFSTSEYASFDLLTGASLASGWSIQMKPSSTRLDIVDRSPSDNIRMTFFNGGNIGINTTTDSGYKLDVNGTTRLGADTVIKGSNSSGGTYNFQVQNSGGSFQMGVRADGFFVIANSLVASSGTVNIYDGNNLNMSGGGPTSATQTKLSIGHLFQTSTGSNTFTVIGLSPTINQTGTASGITRGLYINPTLTSAVDFRAIETSAGKIVFGSLTSATTTKVVYYNSATGQLSQGDAPVTSYARRSDFVVDTDYMGVAVAGSSESASVWKIYKIVVSSSGATTKTSATNVAWTDRYTVTYS